MEKMINQATEHLYNCSDCIVEARTALYEAEDSPNFKGNLADIRDRIDEINSILYDLNEVQAYLENFQLEG